MGAAALVNGVNGLSISTDIQFGDTESPSHYASSNGFSNTPSSIRSHSPSQTSSSTVGSSLPTRPDPQPVTPPHHPNTDADIVCIDTVTGTTYRGKRNSKISVSRCNYSSREFPAHMRTRDIPISISLPQQSSFTTTSLTTLYNQFAHTIRSSSHLR